MRKEMISDAQKEVWSWKEDCYRDIADLDTTAAINKRMRDAVETINSLGLYTVDTTIRSRDMVAESSSANDYPKR